MGCRGCCWWQGAPRVWPPTSQRPSRPSSVASSRPGRRSPSPRRMSCLLVRCAEALRPVTVCTKRRVGDGHGPASGAAVHHTAPRPTSGDGLAPFREVQRQAWRWALANRDADGALPAGSEIARQHGRSERWGRLVKSAGLAGGFADLNLEEAAGTRWLHNLPHNLRSNSRSIPGPVAIADGGAEVGQATAVMVWAPPGSRWCG
jgi:hypothetical protein